MKTLLAALAGAGLLAGCATGPYYTSGYAYDSYGYASPYAYGYSSPYYGYATPYYGYSAPYYGYAGPSIGFTWFGGDHHRDWRGDRDHRWNRGDRGDRGGGWRDGRGDRGGDRGRRERPGRASDATSSAPREVRPVQRAAPPRAAASRGAADTRPTQSSMRQQR
jgi:hypothetical protein